tara:strand:- start:88 stop:1320 length:1233 start_codon:yes stop_codon:yes gene_type:complete
MANNSQTHNEEINLIELVKAVWVGKLKIAIVVIISLTATIIYQSTQTDNFTAITQIKPISPIEKNKYLPLKFLYLPLDSFMLSTNDSETEVNNSDEEKEQSALPFEIFQIKSENFLDLYLEILEDKSVFEDAIRKFDLLDASKYSDEKKYNEAITKLASSIKILSPLKDKKGKLENLENEYHTINFIHNDVEKWKNILKHTDKLTNELARKILLDEFNNFLTVLRNDQKYQVEDLSIEIKNMTDDYNRKISDRVSFLEEQSQIAKTLGIAKNTIEVQTFGNQNALLSNIQIDSPFYLRGYEAIDKEIELMSFRSNKNAFIDGLLDLEIKKRKIEQDKTVERLKFILQSTPLADKNKFSAASLNTFATKFEFKDNKIMLLKSVVIGFLLGVFYVMIFYSFQPKKVSRKTTK